MSAVLHPRQFFHGTDAELAPGDVIHPGSEVGVQNTSDSLYRPNRVYITPYTFVARNYAWKKEGARRQPVDAAGNRIDSPKFDSMRPSGHIYEVEPLGRVVRDRTASQRMGPQQDISYEVRSARVLRRLSAEEWS